MESSSPAVELKKNESLAHNQITVHYYGNREALNNIAKTLTQLPLEELEKSLP
jgi:hypothetical protein